MESVHEKLLAYAARRAGHHPAYVGWMLRRYQEIENRSDDDLARQLTVSLLDLRRLSLCLRPRPDRFAEDLERIGEKFSANLAALAGVIRLVESVEAMGAARTDTLSPEAGLLMAARTRKKLRARRDNAKNEDRQPKP